MLPRTFSSTPVAAAIPLALAPLRFNLINAFAIDFWAAIAIPLRQLARSVARTDASDSADFPPEAAGMNREITSLMSPNRRLEIPPPKGLGTSPRLDGAVPGSPRAQMRCVDAKMKS